MAAFSLGLVERSLRIALVIAPLTITAYIIGLPHGPKGVAFSYSAMMMLWLIPHILWCTYGTVISFLDILKTIGRPLLSGISAAIIGLLVQFYCGQLQSPLLRLILGSGAMLIAYVLVLFFVMRQKTLYLDLLRSMKRDSPV